MNQKQIVLEHRNALDAFEEAKSKQASCARKGTCKDEIYCLTCPARLTKEHCEAVFNEKSKALQKLNDRIVKQNDEQALQQRIDRQNKIAKKKERARIMASQRKYSREDLTLERYLQHRDKEELLDREIREMYDIPRGSFGKIKKDLLAQVEPIETPNDVVESVEVEIEQAATTEVVEEIEEPTVTLKPQITVQAEDVGLRLKITRLEKEYDSVVSQLKQAIENNNELQKQVMAANNQLTQEQQFSNELKDMVNYLENKLKEQPPVTAPVEQAVVSVEQNEADYKELYEKTRAEFRNYMKYEIVNMERLLQLLYERERQH